MSARAALLEHFKHSESDFDQATKTFIRPPLVDGCAHCESGALLPAIHAVWTSGNADARRIIWSLQDGYGSPGHVPPQGFDWSGIRDSTPDAIKRIHAAIHA